MSSTLEREHVRPADVTAGPLDALRELREQRERIARVERETIRAARANGHSWEQVARALGMTRQAAWQRWGRPASSGNGGTTAGEEAS